MKLTTPKKNREETQVFLNEKPENFAVQRFVVPYGYRLLIGSKKMHGDGEHQTICLVTDSKESETVYKVKMIVRNEPNAYLSCKNCTQLIVWRSTSGKHRFVTSGFPSLVFNHLLQTHDIMITDEQQTDDGRRFWLDRIGEALYVPEQFVYYVDLNELNSDLAPKISKIDNEDELFETYVPKGWGDDESDKNKAFVISRRDLSTLTS
ncbi:hypothetical protein CWN84_25210 [Vibrio splendidus]|nr:hypothetical protein CWN84_25210 [Vibrio splendidus]